MPPSSAPLSPPPAAAVPWGGVPRLDGRALGWITGLFLLSRLLVVAMATLSHVVVVQGGFPMYGRSWIERFCFWDAGWYTYIAGNGYSYDPQGESSVAFYPLLPLLMRAAGFLGADRMVAGYVISLGALYAACVLLWRLAARETRSATVADRAVLFLLFCPGSMWFGMIYTESLFLLTTLGCMLCARQGRWLAAGLWGLLAALTRTPGLLLAGFLFVEAGQQWAGRRAWRAPSPRGRWWQAARWPWTWRAALAMAGPVAGHASYLLFLQLRFGDWRAQQKTMAAGWGGHPQWPWNAVASQWTHLERIFVDVSMPLLGITLALALVGLWTLRRLSYAALVFALAVLYVSATPGDSVTRYLSTAAPVYIVLAQLGERSRLLETTALVFSVAVMTLLTALRANGYHII